MNRKLLPALLCLVLFQGCNVHEAGHEAGGPSAADRSPAPTVGKPQAPIDISFEIQGAAKVDQPLSIRLDVGLTQGRTGTIELAFRADPGLELVDGDAARSIRVEAANAKVPVTIEVVPREKGLAYVHVVAQLPAPDGIPMARAVSIPITFGGTAGEAGIRSATEGQVGEIQTDENGQRLHVMPAEASDGKGG